MEIRYNKKFKKQFKNLPEYAVKKFSDRLHLLLQNSNNPILHNHKLSGKYKNSRSINITGDYRLIFTKTEKYLDLEYIGTHSQLYE